MFRFCQSKSQLFKERAHAAVNLLFEETNRDKVDLFLFPLNQLVRFIKKDVSHPRLNVDTVFIVWVDLGYYNAATP